MELSVVFQILGWISLGLVAYLMYDIMTRTPPSIATPESQSPPTTESPTPESPPPPPPPLQPDEKKARFLFFYANWCPWSKKARPQWDAFRKSIQLQPVMFGTTCVQLEEIDGDTNAEMRRKYGVSAYPTFKLLLPNNEVRELSGVPTVDSMLDFLTQTLGPEEPLQLAARPRKNV
jgi:thiol-disulfide isomerase/thioredoxin